jgi:hypothetical protein
VIAIILIMFYKEYVYALLYCKGLKTTIGIKSFIEFGGMPLLLRVQLSWICVKPSFSGSSAVVILVVNENGENFLDQDQEI